MLIVPGTNLLTRQLVVFATCYSLMKKKKGEFERDGFGFFFSAIKLGLFTRDVCLSKMFSKWNFTFSPPQGISYVLTEHRILPITFPQNI